MEKGTVQAYYGSGKGKTSAALGCAIHEASRGGSCIIIQFLKGKDEGQITFVSRLEPEIRLFHFQKFEMMYDELNEEQKRDARNSIQNGLNYARKVMNTGECSMLILDEALGLIDNEIISAEDLIRLIEIKPEDMSLLLTGRVMDENLLPYLNTAYHIKAEKEA